MRHSKEYLKKCATMGRSSQCSQENKRLAAALEYGPIRPTESIIILKIWIYNPRTESKNRIEIKHEIDNGNDRYNVYLNGNKWRKPWSRWGFCRWLFGKIDSVVVG